MLRSLDIDKDNARVGQPHYIYDFDAKPAARGRHGNSAANRREADRLPSALRRAWRELHLILNLTTLHQT